jgi:hypothetical protein
MILPALDGRAERPPDTCLDLNIWRLRTQAMFARQTCGRRSRSGALSSWHSAVDLDLKLRRFAFSTEATSEVGSILLYFISRS